MFRYVQSLASVFDFKVRGIRSRIPAQVAQDRLARVEIRIGDRHRINRYVAARSLLAEHLSGTIESLAYPALPSEDK